MDRNELIQRIGFIGVQPFQNEVTKSPSHSVIDAPSFQHRAKGFIQDLCEKIGDPSHPRSLVLVAPPGYGKSHLLAWARAKVESNSQLQFVYVPPFRNAYGSWDRHLLASLVDAILHNSDGRRAIYARGLRERLVGIYDRMARSEVGRKSLGIRFGFFKRLTGQFPKIADELPDDQLFYLAQSWELPGLMERVVGKFRETNPAIPGFQVDRDSFIALNFLLLGNEHQRWVAERWFRNQVQPASEREKLHLHEVCQGAEKIKNSIYTIAAALGVTLVMVFDQLEDTFQDFEKGGQLKHDLERMALDLGTLYTMPSIAFLFSVTESVWGSNASQIPPQFTRRMVEGYGPIVLEPLDLASARELIAERMRVMVWDAIGEPVPRDAYFPFTDAEIREMFQQAGGRIVTFIRLARERYQQHLEEAGPVVPKPIRITEIEPKSCLITDRKEIEIRGEYLPTEADVWFGDCKAEDVRYLPDRKVLVVTPPEQPVGIVPITVQASDGRRDVFPDFEYRDREPLATPYWRYIDSTKLRACRTASGKTQSQVGLESGIGANRVGLAERGQKVADEIIIKLATYYGKTLDDLRKDGT